MQKFLMSLGIACLGMLPIAGAAETTVQPLRSVNSAAITGYSMLVRKSDSLLARVELSPASSGQETWWLVFNNPDACAARPCELQDIYRNNTGADLIKAKIGTSGKNKADDFCLQPGKEGRSLMPEMGLAANGLLDVHSAEVQLLVVASSDELKSLLVRSTSGFADKCASGQCSDFMFAVHMPANRPVPLASLGT